MTTVHAMVTEEQERCFQEYRTFVIWLPREDSVPVGHEIEATPQRGNPFKAVVVAKQENKGGEDVYILADPSIVSTAK